MSFQIRADRLATEERVTNANPPAARFSIGASTLETTVSYSDLLKDPRWQRKRLEILERDGWKCGDCGDQRKTLHVHHKSYRRGAKPWEYDSSELFTLCEGCHEKRHRVKARLEEVLGEMQRADAEMVLGFTEFMALVVYGRARQFPLRERIQELGENWFAGFAAGISSLWGSDLDAIESLMDDNGHVHRHVIMGLKRSFSLEPRGNG